MLSIKTCSRSRSTCNALSARKRCSVREGLLHQSMHNAGSLDLYVNWSKEKNIAKHISTAHNPNRVTLLIGQLGMQILLKFHGYISENAARENRPERGRSGQRRASPEYRASSAVQARLMPGLRCAVNAAALLQIQSSNMPLRELPSLSKVLTIPRMPGLS